MHPVGAGQPPTAFPHGLRVHFDRFAMIALADLNEANLQNRVDTKFLCNEAQLAEILERVADDYRVVNAFGHTYGRYASLYYDTPGLAMYLDHHNGVRDRFKVRTRTYLDTRATFLEIKRKTNKERTVKTRMPLAVDAPFDADAARFVAAFSPFALDSLVAGLANDFWRITLVANEGVERITIDVGLRLGLGGRAANLHGLVITEVKQPRFSTRSPYVQELRRLRLEPLSFSKYAIGVAILQPGIKINMLKPRLLFLKRLLGATGPDAAPLLSRIAPPPPEG